MITYTIEYEKDGHIFRSEFRAGCAIPRIGEKVIYDGRLWTVRDVYHKPSDGIAENGITEMLTTVYAH